MAYVYMQKPRPTNTTGVDVTLKVIDPNGNTYDIGTATSDSNGMYSLMWMPEVPGKYTIVATFAGTKGYWPSYAQTALGVLESPETTPGPTATTASVSDMYFIPAVIGIIAAIVLATAVILLVLRKRP